MADSQVLRKSWGVDLLGQGRALFRLWAPRSEGVSLRLDGIDRPMRPVVDGWFELHVAGVKAGMHYAFVLSGGLIVPDPAAHAQDGGVHGQSVIVDQTAYQWRHTGWQGRSWRETVLYELHIGTFTAEGTFRAAAERLHYLAQLGITAVEFMPIGQFPGKHGWGYDGVLPYAPHSGYGTPDDLKYLIDEAHGAGLMIFLDVVYNHFGKEGNHLVDYAPHFFDRTRCTPWGLAIGYDQPPVRQFFIDNALYWLREFKVDGLRLDAIDQIRDISSPELLVELAQAVRTEFPGRHVHLVTEDNRNVAYLHERSHGLSALYTAEWNDDFHNAAHVLLTGETEGYFVDFAEDTLSMLARCLAEGFAFQGQPSRQHSGRPRGEKSTYLPTTAFVNFLQNHDQIGNRAFGERLSVLVGRRKIEALTAILLLSPQIPLVFMGEEWGSTRPFLFFADYSGQLADEVREGRRAEFSQFSDFTIAREVPDPNARETFEASKLDWSELDSPDRQAHLQFFSSLLALRQTSIAPLLDDGEAALATVLSADGDILAIDWVLRGGTLQLRANLGDQRRTVPPVDGDIIYVTECDAGRPSLERGPWSVMVAIRK